MSEGGAMRRQSIGILLFMMGLVVGMPAAVAGPLTLGMAYVVPPHVPGSKVRTPEGLAPLLAEQLGRQLSVQPVAVPQTGAYSPSGPGSRNVDALLLPLDDEE